MIEIQRQEIIRNISLFTSRSIAMFYEKLFDVLGFELPRRKQDARGFGFPKDAMLCAFLAMKCEGFSQVTDLKDYLENNRIIVHYFGFNIIIPYPQSGLV